VFFPLTVLLNWKSRFFFGWTTCLYISGNNYCKLSNVSNKDEVLLLLVLLVVVDRVSCIIRLCQGDNEITVSRFTAMPKKCQISTAISAARQTHTQHSRRPPVSLSARQQNWGCDVLDYFREIFKWYAKYIRSSCAAEGEFISRNFHVLLNIFHPKG
jgi:hypothetical protein